MHSLASAKLRPLVVGLPRTGFTLLISIITELQQLEPPTPDVYHRRLLALENSYGHSFTRAIVRAFESYGYESQLLFNDNFRQLMGGPIWNSDELGSRAYFRKYIGLESMGDFTIVASLPLGALLRFPVLYSHGPASGWLTNIPLPIGQRFASTRAPAGTLNSACFSINALASEYITKRYPQVPAETLRFMLASYKLSSQEFFDALVQPLRRGLEDLLASRESYFLVAWEDIITHPVQTILHVAERLGTVVDSQQADGIWRKLSYRNLTGSHRHNYRAGMAYVGDERHTLTNEHLEFLDGTGVMELAAELGYPRPTYLKEDDYNDFQRRVSKAWRSGVAINDCPDDFLFELAFNKSNLDFQRFGYRQHPWQGFGRVERSSLPSAELELDVLEASVPCLGALGALVDVILESADVSTTEVCQRVGQTADHQDWGFVSEDVARWQQDFERGVS